MLRAASIEFAPTAWAPNEAGGLNYTDWELIEVALCAVPANPEAVRACNALGLPVADAPSRPRRVAPGAVLDVLAPDEIALELADEGETYIRGGVAAICPRGGDRDLQPDARAARLMAAPTPARPSSAAIARLAAMAVMRDDIAAALDILDADTQLVARNVVAGLDRCIATLTFAVNVHHVFAGAAAPPTSI